MVQPQSFSVRRRNTGHWDILSKDGARLFRIRGGPGRYLAMDERQHVGTTKEFKTIGTCMSYICDELMYELIVAVGQMPSEIEAWNV